VSSSTRKQRDHVAATDSANEQGNNLSISAEQPGFGMPVPSENSLSTMAEPWSHA